MTTTKIFTNSIDQTETWIAGGAALTWQLGTGTAELSTLVVQGIEATYSRTISPIFPIAVSSNKMKRINILGSPTGTLTIQSILGPNTKSLSAFLAAVGKGCKNEGVSMTLTPFVEGCDGSNSVKYTFTGVELESLSVTIQGGVVPIVQQPMRFQFTGMLLG